MSRIIYTQNAFLNLKTIAAFWREEPKTGKRAIFKIKDTIKRLELLPQIGKPCDDDDGQTRLLSIRFGSSGYVVRYRYEQVNDTVVVLAIKNFRQAGFDFG